MRYYDLTLKITPGLPTWPGDPPIQIQRHIKMEEGSTCNVTVMNMTAHVGTHIDAPYHFIQDGKTIDQLPLSTMIGRAYVMHFPDARHITADLIRQHGLPKRVRRILFKTRNSNYWTHEQTPFRQNYVSLTPDAAQYLVDKDILLVGIDYVSVAPFEDVVTTHRILLGGGVVVIEGLNMNDVNGGHYTLYALPIYLSGSDGAPARVILVSGESSRYSQDL
jgi:arylformamidase